MSAPTKVYLSLGSNINRYKYISAALDALAKQFGELVLSPVYESVSVGFDGDNFLNLVVGLETHLSVGELSAVMRRIEEDNDRVRPAEKFSARTLDIDILTYGNAVGVVDGIELPRDEISKYGFVIIPLVDIAPSEQHPATGQTYADVLAELQLDESELWPVEFNWPDSELA